jgi:predicted dehydrogenase
MLEHMVRHPGYALVAVWDPDPESCREAQALAPGARIAASAQDAIAAADLVYLARPPGPRKAYALAAAAANKAVFPGKPLGVDIAESEALVAGLKTSGVPAVVNFTQAAGAALTDVAHAARTGALGEVVGADIVVTYPA